MNSRFYWLIVIVILGSIVMGACTASPAATLAPKPTATALPASTATSAPKPMATGPGGFPIGTYKPDVKLWANYMLFTAQGTVVIGLGDADTGSYTVSGDQIVFNMDIGVCHNHPGTYQWEIHGDTLTFKPINETCTDSSRAEDMVGRSWILQP